MLPCNRVTGMQSELWSSCWWVKTDYLSRSVFCDDFFQCSALFGNQRRLKPGLISVRCIFTLDISFIILPQDKQEVHITTAASSSMLFFRDWNKVITLLSLLIPHRWSLLVCHLSHVSESLAIKSFLLKNVWSVFANCTPGPWKIATCQKVLCLFAIFDTVIHKMWIMLNLYWFYLYTTIKYKNVTQNMLFMFAFCGFFMTDIIVYIIWNLFFVWGL